MILALIIIGVLMIAVMVFALVKTYKGTNNVNPSEQFVVLNNKNIFGVNNTGTSMDSRSVYVVSDEALGL